MKRRRGLQVVFRAMLAEGMGTGRTSEGHRIWFALLWLLALAALPAHGQTSSAQLTVNLSVQSSISLVFNNNPNVGTSGFCALKNAGTSNVGLDLGTAAFPGNSYQGCGTYKHVTVAGVGGAFYQVSSSFDVLVTKSNSNSPAYSLAARISTTPPPNVTWSLNGAVLTTALSPLATDTNDKYGQLVTKTLQVQVRNNVPAGSLQETITFLATAN
jgi:hypothetical protein